MSVLRKLVVATAVAAGSALLSPQGVNAFELTGAWATSADQCSKVFARKGRAKQISFTNFSGVYGGGFIADAVGWEGNLKIAWTSPRKKGVKPFIWSLLAPRALCSQVFS